MSSGAPTSDGARGALLVGSVPCETEEEVLRTVVGRVGDRLRTGQAIAFADVELGIEGARRRLEAAARHLDRSFGIATECGFGRQPAEAVIPLLEIHRELTSPLVDDSRRAQPRKVGR